ncbi:integrin alpha-8 isoform X2 [Halictus rubicundus]|uniref:integrin alpha-8 isoform X2 n=1 Tax=Halictus rubicundus TaxID=77578 RepID=UPI004036F09A
MENLSSLVILNIWLCTLIMVRHTVLPYNLDVDNAKIFDIPKNLYHERASYFGFSVAFYKKGKDSILLVGAPRANASATQNVIEPGCMYQCPIRGTCTEWNISKQHKRFHKFREFQNNMWIGATIAVGNKADPRIMVCAPRWKFDLYHSIIYMTGICYWNTVKTIAPFETELEYQILPFTNTSQLMDNRYYIYDYGMSQAGFSLHIPSNTAEWKAVLGSPGMFHWTGAPLITGPNRQVQRINLYDNISYDRYLGYAVTSGCYFGKSELWFASSAPKAANMYGDVIVFQQHYKAATEKLIIHGDQYGEYFGATLTSCDINNDGKDELIIGAPLWSKDVDEGRIYIYKTSHENMFEKHTFEGEISGGRFGTVATCLGDIDYDGYADFAVSAPYVEDTGAIYIFNGNRNGLIKRYSQKIIGKQFGKNIRGFGISISEPQDINNDMYPDIAVGAYLSEQAILIKSKPAIILTTILNHIEEEKLLQNSTYLFIDACTFYDGKYSPTSLGVVHSLKFDQLHGRAFGDEQTLEKHIDETYKFIQTVLLKDTVCNRFKIHLKKNIQNIIDPLEVSTSIALEKDLQPKNKTATPDIFCKTCASINKFLSKTEDSIKLPFAVDCGEDNICISDVRIKLSTDLKDNIYTVGSTSTVMLMINAYNYGEPAYQLKVYIYIPQVLSLASVPPACAEGSHMHNTLEVICDIGNPLRKNETLTLQLDMSEIRYNVKETELTANFTTQSVQVDSVNKSDSLIIYFDADVDITIAGKAHDDLYSYYHDEEHRLTSMQFEHIYEVQKFGVSPLEKVILIVSIPSYWRQSTGDVHIVNLNKTNGNMDGQQFYCTHSNFTYSIPSISTSNIYPINSDFNVQEKFQTETNFSINLPPMNRTLYLNCSNTNVHCTHLECALGPFASYSSVARLSLTLDLYLTNFEPVLQMKDIIHFLSNGSVYIAQPQNITQRYDNKPDNAIVATMFLGSPVTEQLASWIIILSISLGIILLVFLILGLITLGFFNRKKREELKTLKSDMNNENNTIVVNSNSDREEVS